MTGQYGVKDICLSLPCVVGVNGVEEILTLSMNKEEEKGFRSSAEKLKTTLAALEQKVTPGFTVKSAYKDARAKINLTA